MRILSWNVNGIRAIAKTPRLLTCLATEAPDILCLQEIKTQDSNDLEFLRALYPYIAVATAEKKGYSGVALLSKEEPITIETGFKGSVDNADNADNAAFLKEGRILTAEYADRFVVCTYVPNAKADLVRLEERMVWEAWMRRHVQHLSSLKPVILCGDLNVCHTELDYWSRPAPKTPGLSPQEKEAMGQLLESCDLVDSFRFLHPIQRSYSYWSPFGASKEKGKGWRLDYVLVSRTIADRIAHAACLEAYCTSDHGPVLLDIS
jgi:exodeoxyribonuclease-3